MRLSHRFLDALHGPLSRRMFFLHMPNCAGSSISNAIVKYYISLNIKNDKGIISVPAEAAVNVRKLLNEEKSPEVLVSSNCSVRIAEHLLLYFMSQKNVKFVAGHVPFSEIAYRSFHQQFSFITIIRDPVKRWLSEYMLNRFKKSMHNKEAANMDIDVYIDSKVGKAQGRQYVLFLGGRVNSDKFIPNNRDSKVINILIMGELGVSKGTFDLLDSFVQTLISTRSS